MIDFIWGLSGPTMLQVREVEYRVPLPDGVGGNLFAQIFKPASGSLSAWDFPYRRGAAKSGFSIAAANANRTWFAITVSDYTSLESTGDDATPYQFGRIKMFVVDPMLQYLVCPSDRLAVYAGAGASYNRLHGEGFSSFNNAAVKLKVGVMLIDWIDVGLNVRFYPNGFTADEFTENPVQHVDRPKETVVSISGGLAWSRRR
jgi:hypothetical protein